MNRFKKNIVISYYHPKTHKFFGYLKGIVIHASQIYQELQNDEVLKIFQMDDIETQEEVQSFYMHVLSKNDCQDNAFYITEFFLERESRGNGFGTRFIKELPQILKQHLEEPISCLYLLPGPLEKINNRVEYIMNPQDPKMISLKEKLIKFYFSLGFRQVKNTVFLKKTCKRKGQRLFCRCPCLRIKD